MTVSNIFIDKEKVHFNRSFIDSKTKNWVGCETEIVANKKVKTVSAGCGRGKTYATCQHIKGNITYSNHLYVAPTKKLLQQTQKQLSRSRS